MTEVIALKPFRFGDYPVRIGERFLVENVVAEQLVADGLAYLSSADLLTTLTFTYAPELPAADIGEE